MHTPPRPAPCGRPPVPPHPAVLIPRLPPPSPSSLLNDRTFVKRFAALSDPFVRNVDKIIGEAVVGPAGKRTALVSRYAPVEMGDSELGRGREHIGWTQGGAERQMSGAEPPARALGPCGSATHRNARPRREVTPRYFPRPPLQAMRVEVDMVGGKNSSGIFVHKYLSQSMGYSTAAFAQSVLQGKTQPGVWYPEEREALQVGIMGAGHGCGGICEWLGGSRALGRVVPGSRCR